MPRRQAGCRWRERYFQKCLLRDQVAAQLSSPSPFIMVPTVPYMMVAAPPALPHLMVAAPPSPLPHSMVAAPPAVPYMMVDAPPALPHSEAAAPPILPPLPVAVVQYADFEEAQEEAIPCHSHRGIKRESIMTHS
jgi:hypothetical protein